MALRLYTKHLQRTSVAASGTNTVWSNRDLSNAIVLGLGIFVDGASGNAEFSLLHVYNTGTTTKQAPSLYAKGGNPSTGEDVIPTWELLTGQGLVNTTTTLDRTWTPWKLGPLTLWGIREDGTNFVYASGVFYPHQSATAADFLVENGDSVNASSIAAQVYYLAAT